MSNKYTTRYLKKEEFNLWNEFVDKTDTGTIFHKSFFVENLSNFTNTNFSIATVFNADQKIVGGFAFAHSIKLKKIKFIYELPLNPFYSPVIADRGTKYRTKNERFNNEILTTLLKFIEKDFKILNFKFPPNYIDLRPLKWEGYSNFVNYTYAINLKNNPNYFDNFLPDLKRQIKKNIDSEYELITDNSAKNITYAFELQNKTLSRKNKNFPLTKNQFLYFCETLDNEQVLKTYTILIDEKPISSVNLLIDNSKAYYLIAGTDPDYYNSGMNHVLLFKIIEEIKEQGVEYFDLVGANNPSVSHYKSAYNFSLVPYYSSSKEIGVAKQLWNIKKVIG